MTFGAISPAITQREKLYKIIDTSASIFLVNFLTNDTIRSSLSNIKNNYHTILIKSVSLPDIGFTPMSSKRGGYQIHNAGDIEVGNFTINSYNDINGEVQSYWYNWFNKIINGNQSTLTNGSNYRLFPDEYKIDIKVLKLSRTTNEKSIEYTYRGCWPANISGLEMDWDNTDQLPNFNVDMKVDKVFINTFPTTLTTKNINQVKEQFKVLKNKTVDLSKFQTDVAKNAKNVVIDKYDKINQTLQSRLKQSGTELLKIVARRFEEEVRQSLPDYIRDLDFKNYTRLIDQVYGRLEGFTKSQISNLVRDSSLLPSNRQNPKRASWYSDITDITDFPEIDLTTLINWNPTNETRG